MQELRAHILATLIPKQAQDCLKAMPKYIFKS
jgi:hypothetical protein